MSGRGVRRRSAGFFAVVSAIALVACGHGDEGGPTAAQRLQEAGEALVAAGSVHLTMTGTDLPEQEQSYVIGADGVGTFDPPAFEGTFTARFRGVQAEMSTVAVDGSLFVKLPFAPTHVELDPATFNVPDPATLLDAETGLVSLLADTQDARTGERVRIEKEIATEITGTLPAASVRRVLSIGHTDTPFDVTVQLVEPTGEVRSVGIRGQFYPPTVSTYLLTLDEYGAPVTVERP